MPQVKGQRGAKESLHPAGAFRAPTSSGSSASSLPRRAKSKTWIRPQSIDKCGPAPLPGPATLPGFQLSVGTSISTAPHSLLVRQAVESSTPSEQSSYVRRKKNSLTRVQPEVTSSPAVGSGSTAQNLSPEIRRLIHQGRHKLVQKPGQQSRSQSGASIQTQTGLEQHRRFDSTQSRKRAGPGISLPAAKKANTWVRNDASPAGVSATGANNSKPLIAGYVRSMHSRKLQLVRRRTLSFLTMPATPVSRFQSRGTVLAKQLSSVRSLNRTRRPMLTVRNSGVVKPGKLQRIDGVLYKVGGSGLGKSLQRQLTPKSIRPLLSPQGEYIRQGKHLILRSIASPQAVVRRLNAARGGPSKKMSAAKTSVRQKVAAAHIRRPSRLRKSSHSAQTHCLVYCRTGQCREQQAGKCRLVHAPAAVAVCPRWLQGSCSDSACKLQHQRCPDVMPVCTFYLQGVCTTEDCPYAHVKVDPNAPVCQEFVSGHCPRGVACTKKHLTPRMIRQLRQSKALQGGQCTSQHSTVSTGSQLQISEKPVVQEEDQDLRPAFLR